MKKQEQVIPDIFRQPINETAVKRVQQRKRTTLTEKLAENIRVGVMLRQSKSTIAHGMYKDWFEKNLADSLSARTSRRYYQLALRFYRSEAAAEFAALPAEVQQAQLNGESDNSVFLAAVEDFLGMD